MQYFGFVTWTIRSRAFAAGLRTLIEECALNVEAWSSDSFIPKTGGRDRSLNQIAFWEEGVTITIQSGEYGWRYFSLNLNRWGEGESDRYTDKQEAEDYKNLSADADGDVNECLQRVFGAVLSKADRVLFTEMLPEGSVDVNCFYSYRDSVDDYTILNRIPAKDEQAYPADFEAEEIVVPDGTESIAPAQFRLYPNLQRVTLPDSVTEIGEKAFWGCRKLTQINIPAHLKTIGTGAFFGCISLAEKPALPDNVQIGASAFRGTGFRIEEIKRISGDEWKISGDGELLAYLGSGGDVSVPDGVTAIPYGLFKKRTDLTSVTIPDTVTKIGESAFSGCTALKNVRLPNGLTVIPTNAFAQCSGLTELIIPDGVTHIHGFHRSGAFLECTALVKIKLPDSLIEIGDAAFKGCSSLKEIHIPDSVTSIGKYVFSDCTSLTSVSIPNGIKAVSGFERCANLTEVRLPDSVTTIEYDAFLGCSSLTALSLPESVSYIGQSAFMNCSALKKIAIPKGIRTIHAETFAGCSELSDVSIPDGVTEIQSAAFSGCQKLHSLNMPDSVLKIESDAFQGTGVIEEIALLQNNLPDKIFSSAVLSLKTEDEAMRFWLDLCSIPECAGYVQRLCVAMMLANGKKNDDIVSETRMSSSTIAKVRKMTDKTGTGTLIAVIRRLEAKGYTLDRINEFVPKMRGLQKTEAAPESLFLTPDLCWMKLLNTALLTLENQKECLNFFLDLCLNSEKDFMPLVLKIQAAMMLSEGDRVDDIRRRIGISAGALQSISYAMTSLGTGGYQLVLDRLFPKE